MYLVSLGAKWSLSEQWHVFVAVSARSVLSTWWTVHREVDFQGVDFFALWKCMWKGQQHMDLACPRHGCGSLGTFCACSKCRKKGGERSRQWAVWGWQRGSLWAGAEGGPAWASLHHSWGEEQPSHRAPSLPPGAQHSWGVLMKSHRQHLDQRVPNTRMGANGRWVPTSTQELSTLSQWSHGLGKCP